MALCFVGCISTYFWVGCALPMYYKNMAVENWTGWFSENSRWKSVRFACAQMKGLKFLCLIETSRNQSTNSEDSIFARWYANGNTVDDFYQQLNSGSRCWLYSRCEPWKKLWSVHTHSSVRTDINEKIQGAEIRGGLRFDVQPSKDVCVESKHAA